MGESNQIEPRLNVFQPSSKDDGGLNAKDVICLTTAILGISDSGKSNTAAVLIEELLDKNVGVLIYDPEGEYWGLKEKYPLLQIGGKTGDIPFDINIVPELARMLIERNISAIVNMSRLRRSEWKPFATALLAEIWNLKEAFPERPFTIVVEEAQEFIPQKGKQKTKRTSQDIDELEELIIQYAKRGRKWGLGLVLISQRAANVNKDALSQANLYFLHRIKNYADFSVYQNLLDMPPNEIKKEVPTLQKGEVFFRSENITQRRKIRLRHTLHVSKTPTLQSAIKPPPLKQVSAEIISVLNSVRAEKEQKADEITKLNNIIREKDTEFEKLNTEISSLHQTISNLKNSLEIASNLRVNLQLPTEQTINHAIIKSFAGPAITQAKEPTKPIPAVSGITPHPPPTAPPQQKESQLRPEFLPQYEKILSQLKSVSPHEIKVLALLEKFPTETFPTSKIAAWLNESRELMQHSAPKTLVKLSIILQKRISRELAYQTDLRHYIKRAFILFEPQFTQADQQIVFNKLKVWIDQRAQIRK